MIVVLVVTNQIMYALVVLVGYLDVYWNIRHKPEITYMLVTDNNRRESNLNLG